MPSHTPSVPLYDILETITEIQSVVQDLSLEAFNDNWLHRRAVERGIEIISEASRRVPDEMKAEFSEIPWPKIAAIGNVLRHEYAYISSSIIWEVIHVHLPPLKTAVKALIDKYEK